MSNSNSCPHNDLNLSKEEKKHIEKIYHCANIKEFAQKFSEYYNILSDEIMNLSIGNEYNKIKECKENDNNTKEKLSKEKSISSDSMKEILETYINTIKKIIENDNIIFPFGNSDEARIGEPVLAIGNPFNLTSTVTAGIISAKARYMNIIKNPGVESTIESFIQTDAAVNSGNSGGALVNARAELIGINTAIASADGYYTGYSFAIPSNIARKVTYDLRTYGTVQRGYLGVNVTEVTNDIANKLGMSEPHGILVARVIPKCAADRAGMKAGDVLETVNGVAVNTYASMMEEVGLFYPGDTVPVTYYREGQRYETTLTLLNSKGNDQIDSPRK